MVQSNKNIPDPIRDIYTTNPEGFAYEDTHRIIRCARIDKYIQVPGGEFPTINPDWDPDNAHLLQLNDMGLDGNFVYNINIPYEYQKDDIPYYFEALGGCTLDSNMNGGNLVQPGQNGNE